MSAQRMDDVRQKVLVVDDDRIVRELLADYLGGVGCEVHTAPDGCAGLRAVGESRFDLILTDYHMPAMTGIEMATYIRRFDMATQIILLTGDSSTLDPEIVAQAGIARVLLKPLKLNELLTDCSLAAV